VIAPEKLVHITPEEAAKQSPDYLFEDLAKRIAQKPGFSLESAIAEPGDQTKDASLPWPDDRNVVDLGVLTLTRVVPNSLEAQKSCCSCRRTSHPVSSSPTTAAERALCRLWHLVWGGASSRCLHVRRGR